MGELFTGGPRSSIYVLLESEASRDLRDYIEVIQRVSSEVLIAVMQNKWIRSVLIGASVLVSTATRALDTTPPPAPPPNGVSIGWMLYVPATLTVTPGTTVTWKNWDESDHTVQFADQKSPRIIPNATYSRAFTTPGEYPYHCWLHGMRMAGTIVVK